MGFLPRVGDLGKSRLCASEGLGEGRAWAGRPMPTARAGDRGHRMALELPGVPPASRPPPLCPPFPETGSEKGSQDLGMILLGLPEVVQWATKPGQAWSSALGLAGALRGRARLTKGGGNMEFCYGTPPHRARGCEMLAAWTDSWMKTPLRVQSAHPPWGRASLAGGRPGAWPGSGRAPQAAARHDAGGNTTGCFAGLCHT